MRLIVSFIVGLISISFPAFAWDGSYSVSGNQSNDGINHCSPQVILKSTSNEKGEVQQIELFSDLEEVSVFKNDLHFAALYEGFLGYNRFGGKVSSHEATRITTTTSLAAATVFLPWNTSFGQRLLLSADGKRLTLKGHDTIYGYGLRYVCLYQRDEVQKQ